MKKIGLLKMAFPASVTGAFNVETPGAPDQYVPLLKTAISDWLFEKRARAVSQTAQGISFKAGLFRFVWNLNPLVAIGSGDIEVMRQGTMIHVAYRLRFTELLMVVTSAVALFFGPPMWNAPNLNAIEAIGWLMFFWSCLFGGNYMIARYRVPNALKQVAQRATGGKVS